MNLHLSDLQRRTYSQFAELSLPRHTSYPAANFWDKNKSLTEIIENNDSSQGDISLYFHIPFCHSLCFYCACQKEVCDRKSEGTREKISTLLESFAQELSIKKPLLKNKKVSHIHFGGGTPSFLNNEEWLKLWDLVHEHVTFSRDPELAIELDPRTIDRDRLKFFRGLGFNRISLGVQDFNSKVQKAINREQSYQQVKILCEAARELGYKSINFDLIYGLPFQTLESMEETLRQVATLAPDRIAFYRLAVLPEMFKWQKTFLEKDLPQGLLPLELNLLAINYLRDQGYDFIGLDHFAKHSDELAVAQKSGALHRNFQGMTAGRDQTILGFGPSAISALGDTYFQNPRERKHWVKAIYEDQTQYRAHVKNVDDHIRHEVIQSIYNYGTVDVQAIEDQFNISWDDYFSNSIALIKGLEEKGLVDCTDYMIKENGVLGRLLRRVIAAAFDKYLPDNPFVKGTPGKASQVG